MCRRAGNRAAHLGVESPCRCAPACHLSAKSRPSSPRWIVLQTPTAPTSHIRLKATGECHVFSRMIITTRTNQAAPRVAWRRCCDEQARRPQSAGIDNSGRILRNSVRGARIGPTNHMPVQRALLHIPVPNFSARTTLHFRQILWSHRSVPCFDGRLGSCKFGTIRR